MRKVLFRHFSVYGKKRSGPTILYEHHLPTTPVEKIGLSLVAAVQTLLNPKRADRLAVLGEVTGHDALKKMHQKMCSNPTGAEILRSKPLIRSETTDFNALQKLPVGTFGRAYSEFMDSHGFEADGRAYVQYVDDRELAYVMQRYRELHDFWHVLFDLPPTEFGEIILKYVELTQTELPVCALSAFVGPVRVKSDERRQLISKYIPWASRVGKSCPDLLSVYYEKEFSTPLEELRQRLNVEIAPKMD